MGCHASPQVFCYSGATASMNELICTYELAERKTNIFKRFCVIGIFGVQLLGHAHIRVVQPELRVKIA
jgi:hypothetical protein